MYERLEPVFRALSQEEPGVVKADPQSPAVRVSGQGRGHKVLRRQQESSVPLVADVTILPSSLEATKVEEARGIAEEVNSNANSGALNFEVEGESVAVKESVLNPDVIVEPGVFSNHMSCAESKYMYVHVVHSTVETFLLWTPLAWAKKMRLIVAQSILLGPQFQSDVQ